MINVYFSELPKTLTEILGLKYDGTMSYEERVQKRYDYIKEQYELDNKYEGWDYLENVKYGLKFDHLITFEYMISTKGRILTLFMQEGRYKVLRGDISRTGYSNQTITMDKSGYKCSRHRSLSSTFIPKPSHYKQGINRLVVNHKDLIKLNNHFTNLEWCTNQENLRHQVIEHGKVNVYFNQIFEGTVEIDCKYKGVKFKVFGAEGLEEIGLYRGCINEIFSGRKELSFGCSWKIITQEEADKLPDIPEFIKDKFINNIPYTDIRVKPLKGTVVRDCEYKGLEFVTYGKQELVSLGFNQGNVSVSITTGKVTQSCLWEYISRDEAELLQRGLTKDQQKVIVTKRGPNKK
ncbi:putative HNH endonuclease [Aeromonas phage PS2]|uniref:HNH endonuclease n=1 Tax=Aeromonas phage PS1 TaxID=2591406 RepID=A0A514TUR7_9CAUD|nr:HNH endonuclease [Aeromonas phage PS1]QDJ96768.1 putative HNH endonuclease [Aeromonas phage PS1]QFR59401.1 putative HNH endonuclease [Aeromonas phage PS2]